MKEEIQVRISEEELIAKSRRSHSRSMRIMLVKKFILYVFSVEVVFLPVNWQNILQCRLPWIL